MDNTKQPMPGWVKHTASLGGLGFFPVASGTAGTAGAILLYLVLVPLPPWLYALATLAVFLLGVHVSERARLALGDNDPSMVVIDEAAGFLVTMFMLEPTLGNIIGGFLLFRLFDIVKPWPAKFFDREVKNGWGIMMDDIAAGVYAALVLDIIRAVWN